MAGGWRTLVVAAMLVAGLGFAEGASAQTAKKAAAAKAQKAEADGEAKGEAKKDAAGAQKALESGIKSFEAGKLDPAVASLTSAISSGALQSQQMARALYFRGVAFRKQGKPAQAISDLTSALWLKGGLSDTERAAAIDNRAGAYREAGLVEPTQVETARTSPAAGRPAAVAEKAAPTAAAKVAQAAAPAQAGNAQAGWQTSTSARQGPAPAPATTAAVPAQPAVKQAAPVPSRFVGSMETDNFNVFKQPAVAPAPGGVRERVATAPSDAERSEAPPQAQQQSTGGGILKGLFGDLSLGGSAPKRPEPAAAAPLAPASSATSSWSDTKVAASGRQAAVAPPQPTQPAAGPPQPEGRYRLQVAAVRTKQEADTVAARLKQQHAKDLKSRGVEIDEATLASVGTFYRVRVGPYADANEPRNLCVKLRQKGYDCLVVSVQ